MNLLLHFTLHLALNVIYLYSDVHYLIIPKHLIGIEEATNISFKNTIIQKYVSKLINLCDFSTGINEFLNLAKPFKLIKYYISKCKMNNKVFLFVKKMELIIKL